MKMTTPRQIGPFIRFFVVNRVNVFIRHAENQFCYLPPSRVNFVDHYGTEAVEDICTMVDLRRCLKTDSIRSELKMN